MFSSCLFNIYKLHKQIFAKPIHQFTHHRIDPFVTQYKMTKVNENKKMMKEKKPMNDASTLCTKQKKNA